MTTVLPMILVFFDAESDVGQDHSLRSGPLLGSDERIVGGAAEVWLERADKLRAQFGSGMGILIVIREPKSFFRSVYQQDAIRQLPIRVVDEFFSGATGDSHRDASQINFRAFDLNKLISICRSRFDLVVVQKFESVLNLDFLREFMPLNDHELMALRRNIGKRRSNRSYSPSATALTLKMAGLLNSNMPDPNASGGIPKTRRSRFWRMLMRDFYDRIVPYRKLEIDWQKDVFGEIDEMCAQYEHFPDLQVLRG